MRKLFIIATLLLGIAAMPAAAKVKKLPLKVLYVGGMTDADPMAKDKPDSLVQKRTNAFRELLETYFTSVDVLINDQYSAEISKNYDVTVLDGTPKAIVERGYVRDSEGNPIRYNPGQYFPEDYDCATMTIASIGDRVGRGFGVKNDWYCLCLDAQAHSWVKDHPIFKGPFKTEMTVETCPTPEAAYHYKYYYDGEMPDSLPMWRVQTQGYIDTPGFNIGMVARPWGYTDSPDAEYISSGVCAKTLDAVALGRHGNFFHWGFAASPIYMTEEAKVVFANAVAYIAKFNHKPIQARKFNDRIATREYLKEVAYLVTAESYEERQASDSIFTKEQAKIFKEATAKKAAGEKLSEREAAYLSYGDPGEFKRTPREEYVKRYAGEFYPMFGIDEKAYAKYFKENYPYFYSEGFYNIFVDDDVKVWGLDNHSTALLDKAITCLEEGKETDRANRILARYTMADFSTPAEWRSWFDTYRDKMYFTESGGWKFLIDGPSSIPGNDYFEHNKRIEKNSKASTGLATSDENPVIATASLSTGRNDEKLLELKVKIHPGYHIYANVGNGDPFIPTDVKLNLPEGLAVGDVKISSPSPFGSNGTTIYETEAVYTYILTGHGTGPIACTLNYQCCDAHICFPPASKELKVKL